MMRVLLRRVALRRNGGGNFSVFCTTGNGFLKVGIALYGNDPIRCARGSRLASSRPRPLTRQFLNRELLR